MAAKRRRDEDDLTDDTGDDVKREDPVEINTWIPLDDKYEYRRSAERGLDVRRRDSGDRLVTLFENGNAQIMSANRGICGTMIGETLQFRNTFKNLEVQITPTAVITEQQRAVGVYHGGNTSAEVVYVPAKRKMKLPLGVRRCAQEYTACKGRRHGQPLTMKPDETKEAALLRAESIRQAHIAQMAHLKKRVGVPYEMCACADPEVMEVKAEQ